MTKPNAALTGKVLAVLLAALLLVLLPVAPSAAQYTKAAEQQNGLSARQAAQKAKSRHGGKVLKVTPKGSGYQVKLLLDNGRVKTVRVEG